MKADNSSLSLAPRHDAAQLRQQFAEHGRVHIPNLLSTESANTLYHCMTEQAEWNLVYTIDGKHINASASAVAKWPLRQRQKLSKLIFLQASNGFQYNYKAIPIYDIYHNKTLPGHFFNEVFEFVNNACFLNFVRSVTGFNNIDFADAQATCYEQQHFLTSHDDNVAGKRRLAAYVLNLTPTWRTDWGGALKFLDEQDRPLAAFSPSYNALNLFQVPTRHAVEFVTPFATTARLSITGWLRNGADPGP